MPFFGAGPAGLAVLGAALVGATAGADAAAGFGDAAGFAVPDAVQPVSSRVAQTAMTADFRTWQRMPAMLPAVRGNSAPTRRAPREVNCSSVTLALLVGPATNGVSTDVSHPV